jgi:predicted dehydrogenase
MKTVRIAMNGVTGRMGTNQHLVRSILAIREQGGVALTSGEKVMPEPILLGRNAEKLQSMAKQYGVEHWSTDIDAVLKDPGVEVYFDAQVTQLRAEWVARAIKAGKNVYCEKPLAPDSKTAFELADLAAKSGLKCGIVQDKLFLPGLRKLKQVIKSGFLGRIFSVRGEFGYWVFEGDLQPQQRPSWNYRKEDGGGMILDMFAHWQYVFEGVIAPVKSVSCRGVTHIPKRIDEAGKWYDCTADDAAYATLELEGGIIASMNSSWCVRVDRDDLLILQVDGTDGTAVAGLRDCKIQHKSAVPRVVWNPDVPSPIRYRDHWLTVPDAMVYDNAFKVQWESYLRHLVEGTPFPHDLVAGARGVQLAEVAVESWDKRCWVEVP